MDWNKAKKSLVLLFVFINLILATIIVITISEDTIDKQTIQNTIVALRQRNVEVKANIPSKIPSVGTFKLIGELKKEDTVDFVGEAKLKSEYEGVKRLEENKSASSAHNVLLKNFVKSEKVRVIESIEIGYLKKSMMIEDVGVMFVPVWRVALQSGEKLYYNAFSADLMETEII